MPTYGWEPRAYLVTPDHFGRFKYPKWAPLSEEASNTKDLPTKPDEHRAAIEARLDADRQQAAMWQHSISFNTRDAMLYRGWSVEVLAEQCRVGADSMWRLLRGEGPMRLEDFVALHRIFNVKPFKIERRTPERAGSEVPPREPGEEDDSVKR